MNTFQAYLVGVLFGIGITLFLIGRLNPCEPCTIDQCHDKIEAEQKAINFNTFG